MTKHLRVWDTITPHSLGEKSNSLVKHQQHIERILQEAEATFPNTKAGCLTSCNAVSHQRIPRQVSIAHSSDMAVQHLCRKQQIMPQILHGFNPNSSILWVLSIFYGMWAHLSAFSSKMHPGLSSVEPGIGLDDPDESLPTRDIQCFYDSMSTGGWRTTAVTLNTWI